MIKTKEAIKIKKIADVIICDACGKEIKKNKFGEFDDFYHIEKCGDIILTRMDRMTVLIFAKNAMTK